MRCEDKTAKSRFVGIAQRHAAGYLCRSCKDTPGTGRSGNKPTFSTRMGAEWIVDFGQIRAIRTSIRLDGSWYRYRRVDESIEPYWPGGTMSDGESRVWANDKYVILSKKTILK